VQAILRAATQPALAPLSPAEQAVTPADLADLLALVPKADVYLQDEVAFALHPTLTRVWCRKGRRGQRLVSAPGTKAKVYGFGLVDWRDGFFDGAFAPKRSAPPFCEQLERAVARSQTRGRMALVIVDNLGTHTPARSKLVRALVSEHAETLRLVYTPRYDPDSNGIEQLWRVSRREVTHNHQRETMPELLTDAQAHFEHLAQHPQEVLRHIGSPGVQPLGSTVNLPLAA
jgi:DDE superfamily endonuclease